MRIFGLIPARGGSKAVPRKALRLVGGRSLIDRAVVSARGSELDAVYVTTDDGEMAQAAKTSGANLIMRPTELAQDATPMTPVVAHAWETLDAAGEAFDAIALLQPTTPFRTAGDIDLAVRALREGADDVVAVVRVDDTHPSRMYRLGEDHRLVALDPAMEFTNRQDLPAVYHRSGAVYACTRAAFRENARLVGPRPTPLIFPRDRAINIDDETDLAFADFLARRDGL